VVSCFFGRQFFSMRSPDFSYQCLNSSSSSPFSCCAHLLWCFLSHRRRAAHFPPGVICATPPRHFLTLKSPICGFLREPVSPIRYFIHFCRDFDDRLTGIASVFIRVAKFSIIYQPPLVASRPGFTDYQIPTARHNPIQGSSFFPCATYTLF